MVIRIADLVPSCDTTEQGDVVQAALRKGFLIPGSIAVSFEGMRSATSSFVNVAFVELLDEYSFAEIKGRLKIINSTRQINEMIRHRLTTDADKVPKTCVAAPSCSQAHA